MNTWVRDTLIRQEVLETLPANRQQQIADLVKEFQSLGYIDVRTQLGPDQARRESQKQKDKRNVTTLRAFRIEEKIKLLLRTDAQIDSDELKKIHEQRAATKERLCYRIRDIETYCSRQLNSARMNATKQEYQQLKTQLAALT